jgi:DNA sulfur modification protein DndD
MDGSGQKTVTMFFGTNGAGKTALLNAFTWTLYGTTTPGFLFPKDIVNKAAIRSARPGDTVEGWVELSFEHLSNRYVVRRTKRVRRGDSEIEVVELGEPTLELRWCGPDGHWQMELSVSDAIGRVLPEDLHTYFFFDGERIERIVRQEAQEKLDIANATKKLFGLEILERGIKHVDAARKTLERELAAIGDAKTVSLLDEKTGIEASIEKRNFRLDELARNLTGHRKVKEERERRLRELHAVKEIQERRDQLNVDRDTRTSSLRRGGSDLAALLSHRGYTVFLLDACSTYKTLIETMRQRGELPAGIKRQFVDDLLSRNECICGRSLGHDSAENRAAVTKWKERAGLADVEEKAIRMGGEVKQLELQVSEFWSLLDQYEDKKKADREELSRIQRELEQISEKLRSSPQEEVSALEKQLAETTSAIERDLMEQGSIAASIKQEQQRLAEIDRELDKHHANEARQQLAQRRVAAAKEVLSRLEESKRRFEVKFRADLNKKIKGLFDVISYKPYVPEVGDDYSLILRESAGGMPLPVAAGTGESQILSLCFIGAVIALAREYQAKKERLPGPDSSMYPIVMDSPFGSLGPTYRRQIADHITKLADQVVILVTNTQWRGEVEQSLEGKIGRAYLFVYFTTKKEFEKESIQLGGRTYELIRPSPSEFEYTEIEEITNA